MPMEVVVMTEDEFRTYMQEKETEPTYMSDEFTFRNFVVGNSNRFAHGAAVAVSQMPAQVYNPRLSTAPPASAKRTCFTPSRARSSASIPNGASRTSPPRISQTRWSRRSLRAR